MIKLEMTMEEANALANLIDLAVKAGGVRVAAAGATFMQRLEDAAKTTNPEQKEGE
jgi:S-adenosylmethionine:tRNA-ribosyltransferase-isomerase (queuine synthetase)